LLSQWVRQIAVVIPGSANGIDLIPAMYEGYRFGAMALVT